MNERIKELARQSYVTIRDPDGEWLATELDKEKFAELIVRECVEQIITGPNGPAYYAVEAAVRVKQHFGVEE